MLVEDLGDELEIPRGGRVLHRLLAQAPRPEPQARTPMDVCGRARLDRTQLVLGELREERMDPVRASALETRDERVCRLQSREHRLGVRAVEHRVAQLRGELPEHAHPQEERATLLIERGDHLRREVVGDEVVVASEGANRLVRVPRAAQPEGGEEERGRPALRALVQQLDLRRGES